MSQTENYVLRMNPETERILERALEFYARALMGQMDYVCWALIDSQLARIPAADSEEHQQAFDDLMKRRDRAREKMLDAKQEIWPELAREGHSYGVGCSEETDTAWGAYEVLRYTRSWHEHPEGGYSVCFGKPMQWTGAPLPKCRVEEA